MENAVTVREAYSPRVVTDEIIGDYLSNLGNKLTPYHRKQFINICKEFNLSPFAREVYGIPFGDKFNIIVGYEVYLKRAETSGKLAGWKAWTDGEGKNMKGCVEINRTDWPAPFYHEVYIEEYDQGNSMWKSKPRTMIKKVAIAQGFRMAFPVELGGIPYTSDEMPLPEAGRAETPAPKQITRIDTITKADGIEINDLLKMASIPVVSLFERFKITRLGELKVSQYDEVIAWIESQAVVEEIIDVTPETAPVVGHPVVTHDHTDLLQEVYSLATKLGEIRGDSGDDIIDALTKGKVSVLIDLEDKSAAYLTDIKLALGNEIASEG